MPQGPVGGPRPAASSTLSITAKFNSSGKDDTEIADSIVQSSSIFSRVSDVSITRKQENISGESFDLVVIKLTLRSSKVQLVGIDDMVTDLENELGTRSSVEIEAI